MRNAVIVDNLVADMPSVRVTKKKYRNMSHMNTDHFPLTEKNLKSRSNRQVTLIDAE